MERLKQRRLASIGAALLLSVGCSGGNKSGGQPSGTPQPGQVGAAAGTGSMVGTGSGGAGSTPAGTPENPPGNPGYLVVRRLNRPEYNNTVADLLGTKLTPADGFPGDDLGAEFDTVGSALSLPPEYVVAYEGAATTLVDELFVDAARQPSVLTCDVATGGDACAQTVLSAFARRAWRRPLSTDEAQALMAPVAAAKTLGATPVAGLKAALVGVLLSPYFLYKLELDPDPLATAPRKLNPYELATRLSYALWSTTPDAALSASADAGQLATDDQVTVQVDRMLADPRADTLLDNFTAKWLDFAGVDGHEAASDQFPTYTPALAASMEGESRRYLQELLHNPLNVSNLFDARFTFVDSRLATFYGLPRNGASNETDFVKVDTTGTQREGGLLTLGAFLISTSYDNRTSPVRRGEYVFRRLLCDAVPPPPADVPQLAEMAVPGQTLRQRMEAHRANPACSACHNLMDPIGFGLENYDGIGAYRETDSGVAVDSAGVLPDGTAFKGAVELARILARDQRLPRCVTEKFMTFAIGRLLDQPDDNQWLDYISSHAQLADGSMRSIIRTVLLSDAFRSRQSGVRVL
jgi:Protein of unknown function (DUF1592)/Protein of unknown function (DUF1588)/Protein of unknown function (DUF1587)/Protein of unknown function (DUF1595)/Protein of unknown function (DUF1585)